MGGPLPARIRIDPKTGFPVVEESKESKEIEIVEDQDGLEEDDEDDMGACSRFCGPGADERQYATRSSDRATSRRRTARHARMRSRLSV